MGVAAYGLFPIAAAGISLAKKPSYIALFTVIAVVASVGLCVLLIPPLGLQGAATATSLSYALVILLSFSASSRFDVAPFDFRTTLLLFAFAGALMTLGAIDYPSEGVGVAAWLLALVAYVASLFVLGVIGKEERTELANGSRRLQERLSG